MQESSTNNKNMILTQDTKRKVTYTIIKKDDTRSQMLVVYTFHTQLWLTACISAMRKMRVFIIWLQLISISLIDTLQNIKQWFQLQPHKNLSIIIIYQHIDADENLRSYNNYFINIYCIK